VQVVTSGPETVRATPGPGGRPREYGPDVAAAAEVLWEASGRIGPFAEDRDEGLE
jgi:hypothetical protein